MKTSFAQVSLHENASDQPIATLRIPSDEVERASSLAEMLHAFAATHPASCWMRHGSNHFDVLRSKVTLRHHW